MEIQIDFLRHGEPVGGSRYRGHGIDDPLSPKGWEQMREGVGLFRQWDKIVTSPMQRCAAFAEWLSGETGIPTVTDPRIKEIGFGLWEGRTKQDLMLERPDEFARFYLDPVNNTPEGAEPVAHFFERIEAAMDQLLEKSEGQKILVVAHAGVVRAAVAGALGLGCEPMYRFEVSNGRIARINYAKDRNVLLGLNITL